MTLNLTTAIKEINQEKGISEDLILSTIETALTNAYKKYYGTLENLSIKITDGYVFTVNSIKEVVEELDDDLFEVELQEALKYNPAAKIGDHIEIPCNPEEFGQVAIHSAKQTILQKLKEIEKNTQYSEFKSKEGELIIGFVQRIKDDVIYIDLGNYEGILTKQNQAPHEVYNPGDRIKTLVCGVRNNRRGGISVALTRRSEEFVKKLLLVEIPELYDGTVKIMEIKREAGYRTKIAVYTEKEEIDPVGACVGQKGARIQNIIKELEGEKIDIIKWSSDIRIFIENALTPAHVNGVIITNEAEKMAAAIMDESQLSFAIGSRGANINLAKKMTGWNIDVLTKAQAIEAGFIVDHVQKAEELFMNMEDQEDRKEDENIEIGYAIDELEIGKNIKTALIENNILTVEELINVDDFSTLKGFTEEMVDELNNYIEENYEIVEDGEETEEEIIYECPECGASIPENATTCPNCGIEIDFEEEE